MDAQQVLQNAHDIVQAEFLVQAAIGKNDGIFVQHFAVRASRHEILRSTQLMENLFELTKAAKVRLFPSGAPQLPMVAFNMNDAQIVQKEHVSPAPRLGG